MQLLEISESFLELGSQNKHKILKLQTAGLIIPFTSGCYVVIHFRCFEFRLLLVAPIHFGCIYNADEMSCEDEIARSNSHGNSVVEVSKKENHGSDQSGALTLDNALLFLGAQPKKAS